ncbi:hypothetical protein Hanom_Chr14g01283931 [Helianthus anomalus]
MNLQFQSILLTYNNISNNQTTVMMKLNHIINLVQSEIKSLNPNPKLLEPVQNS